LRKPLVNRSQQFARLLWLSLIAPEACEAHRGTEFPGFRLLPTGNLDGAPKAGFGFLGVRRILAQPQFAFEPPQLPFTINDTGPPDMLERLRYCAQSFLGLAGIATGFRQQVEPVR